jgi:ankyrin repeat protein
MRTPEPTTRRRYIWHPVQVPRRLGVVRLLLQYSSDFHTRDDEGQTPFMRATTEGLDDVMQLLLEHGAEDHRV